MEIPQVSISVDTGSDSGAQSIETCREVELDKNSEEVSDVKLSVSRAESGLKRALMCRSQTVSCGPRLPALNTNNSINNNHSVPYNSSHCGSRTSLVFQPHTGVSRFCYYIGLLIFCLRLSIKLSH